MDLRKKQRAVVDALEDIKARDVVVYDVSRLPSMFERVIIASGDSTRQVMALAEHVQDRMKALGARVYGSEGEESAEWVLVDLGDIVVHVMHPTTRSYYNLEEIWGVKPVRLKAPAAASAPPRKAPGKRPRKAPGKTARKPVRKAARRKAPR